MGAPIWWQLEVEGHSYNRRNRNQVRRYLRRTLNHLDVKEDIPEPMKCKERQRRLIQLESLRRQRRRKECTETWRGWWRKRRVKLKTTKSSGRREHWWKGQKVPDCLKGRIVHGVEMECWRLVNRTAKGRRYGVVSDGNRFYGLHL